MKKANKSSKKHQSAPRAREVHLNIPSYGVNACKAYFDIHVAKLNTVKGFEEVVTFREVMPGAVTLTEEAIRKAFRKVRAKGLVLLGSDACDNAIIKAFGLGK